jgi:FlaA1/EpsC-like NDP-sugar epimerase
LKHLNSRAVIAAIHDLVWTALLWVGGFAAFAAAFGSLPALQNLPAVAFQTLPVVLGANLVAFLCFGLYQGMWRYASWHDIVRLSYAVGLAALATAAVISQLRLNSPFPRTLLLLHPLLLILFMSAGRIAYRWYKVERFSRQQRDIGEPVLLLSGDDPPLSLLTEITGSAQWRLVGILEAHNGNKGRQIAGISVLGGWKDLQSVTQRTGVTRVILMDRGLDHLQRREILQLCDKARLKLQVLPDVDDLVSGRVKTSSIRNVELDDLLGRDPVQLDIRGLSQQLGGKVVLVTGAGGSIGSEICRQIARFNPGILVMLELNEFALYQIEQEFEQRFPNVGISCVIGDVKDAKRLEEVFERYQPAVVFHAAAYKHVPIMESENAWEAVRNNAFGTLLLMQTVSRHPVEKLVFISTDKAVNPTSVMGATKRLAEMLLQQWNLRVDTHTVIVRFGNVLGSTGSVVPKFKAQIARGGPVTVTHPEMRRYFMSVSEATQLVLQAGLMGEGGEIFVLDMGKPVKIRDLAADLIRLSGFSQEQIQIEYTGLRPGEKLYEELLSSDETTSATAHRKLRVAKVGLVAGPAWELKVLAWLASTEQQTPAEVRSQLRRFIAEYTPHEVSSTAPSNVVPLRTGTIQV